MKVRDMAQVIVRLKPEAKEWLSNKASKEERSQNWFVSRMIEEAMKRDEQPNQA